MKKTFTGGAIPNSQRIYAKIHDANFLSEIYRLVGRYSSNSHHGIPVFEVTHFRWAIISVISWIFMFMFPHEALFLYLPKWLHSGYGCIIFYAVLSTAALSLTYAAYKFGEGDGAGTYRFGLLAKLVDYSAFVLIAVIAADEGDRQTLFRLIIGVVGFMWEFHSLLKLGWNFLDYTFFEMLFPDTYCIIGLVVISWPQPDLKYFQIVMPLLLFVLAETFKYLFHMKIFDTIEDRHYGMCILAMERYPEKVVELLEGSVLESVVVVSQPKLPSRETMKMKTSRVEKVYDAW
ncbi:hypothetical protein LINGRAHAP2_LOCUS33236 [Linum grandiflorum]